MSNDGFFGQQSHSSAVKARIVSKYFPSWAKNVREPARKRGQPLWYLDLYCGPGTYDDGNRSTPLLVLEQVVTEPSFRDLVQAKLSDIRPDHCKDLEESIKALPGIEKLRYPPSVGVRQVDDALTREFERTRLPPTLSFVDPCGYKGLSLALIRALTKDWGCDCIFFFNYNRINAHLSNPVFVREMDTFFGLERAARLRERIQGLSAQAREHTILEETFEAIQEGSARQAFHFQFKFGRWDKTSHFLILVTKHPVGRKIMRDIMARESSETPDGLPAYSFRPTSKPVVEQMGLFPALSALDHLQGLLLNHFAGQTMTVKELIQAYDQVNPRFRERDHKEALRQLEVGGKLAVNPPASERRTRGGMVTMPDRAVVCFPAKRT